MAGKKDKNRKSLSKKDSDLWKAMTKDVRRLPGRDYDDGHEEETVRDVPARERSVPPPKETPRKKTGTKGNDVDQATARKFTRGKMDIEATIDLHGMNQADA